MYPKPMALNPLVGSLVFRYIKGNSERKSAKMKSFLDICEDNLFEMSATAMNLRPTTSSTKGYCTG